MYFIQRDGAEVWGDWVGDEKLWYLLHAKLDKVEREEQGDWRVRVLPRYLYYAKPAARSGS